MWELGYDGALFLSLPPEEAEALPGSGFYKLSLRRYVKEILPGLVRFKPALTYLEYQRIIALCWKETEKRRQALTISDALREYIESGAWEFNARGCLKALGMLHDMLERMERSEDENDADSYEEMISSGGREV
mgnify:CR=1 FL=1